VGRRPVEARAIADAHFAVVNDCDPVTAGEDQALGSRRMARIMTLMPPVFGIVLYQPGRKCCIGLSATPANRAL
jgi:hypothetical protein